MGQQGRSAGSPLTPEDPPAIGAYELISRLGSGGMGTVYLAKPPDGVPVALKAIRRDYTADPVYRARFHEEVSNARKVASFCTARVLDHGEHDGVLYLVTEYIEGVSLEDHLIEHGALTPSVLHSAAVGVAAALTAIHAAGLVHRDLKPANVMLTLAGPRVIDFGLARSTHVGSRHTNAGMVMGTPGWIAPEQVFEGRTSPAGDVFAWGSLIAYAGLGGHPFGEGDAYVMAARARTAPPDLRGLPAPLDRLVAAAIHPDPARRPAARQLLLELVGAADEPAAQLAATRHLTSSWNPAEFPPLAQFPPAHPSPPAHPGPPGHQRAGQGPAPHQTGHVPLAHQTGHVPLAGQTGQAPPPPPTSAPPPPSGQIPPGAPGAPGASGQGGPPRQQRPPHGPPVQGPPPGGQGLAPGATVQGPLHGSSMQGPPPGATVQGPPHGPSVHGPGPGSTAPRGSSMPGPPTGATGQGPLPGRAPMRGSTGRGPLPPPGPAYPARPRRGLARGCLTVLIIAVVVLALLLFVLTWVFRSSGTAGAESPALDGRLRFAITHTSCPKPAKAAAKRTCQVSLKVDNLGQEARVLYPGQQKLLDGDDAPYPGARLLDTAGKEITPIRIGPGDSFSGSLAFELPKEARPALLELHDSGLSSGVRVKLQ